MAKVFALRRLSTLALRQRRQRLLHQLRLPPNLLRASVVERFNTLRQTHLRPGAEIRPVFYLTQCLAPGTVNKFLLKTPASQATARAATAAFNACYDGLEEISQVNTELLRRAEPLPTAP